MAARLVDGSVALDGWPLPPGVAQHLFVAVADEQPAPVGPPAGS
jgi:DtxR family Mn-dependent transcriptional regulator